MSTPAVARTILMAALVLQLGVAAQSPQAQADAAVTKFDAIMRPLTARTQRRTVLSQGELNAYLRFKASWLPPGITQPAVGFLGANKVSTSVVADLDHVRQKSSGGWFDPTAYMKGKLPVFVSGTLNTGDGRGTFQLESATVDGIPVPPFFIQEIFAYYTRTPEQPSGLRLDAPFQLPSEIERIDVAAGQATVIQ